MEVEKETTHRHTQEGVMNQEQRRKAANSINDAKTVKLIQSYSEEVQKNTPNQSLNHEES